MNKILVISGISIGGIVVILLILNVVTTREMETEVIFDAPRTKVWQVLTENDKYAEWNPFMVSSEGKMELGASITNVMMNKGNENTFTPVITVFNENESLEWLGSGLGGMFKGNHYFRLSGTEDGKTKMLHGERFSGLMSGLIIQMIGEDTHANFELMNEAMKNRVEDVKN